jgi:arsenite-transporting ATPase
MKTWVCCGVGGVGKTTISTALALFYAQNQKVALITIDPAKRLQDALGVKLTHQPKEIFPNLDACMLDAQKCFDDLVGSIHPKKQEMLNNRYYRFASKCSWVA